MKKLLLVGALFGAMALNAAPGKGETVAEGFPAWSGISAKSYLMGREICPSDLRHKVTIVVEVEPRDDLHAQFLKAGEVAGLDPNAGNHFGDNWETMVLKRDVIVLISVRGGGKDVLEEVKTALKPPKDADESISRLLANLKSAGLPMYREVTFDGGPETEGKRPFVYVLGHTGKEPIFQGALDAAGIKSVKGAVSKAKKKMSEVNFAWVPFYGSLAEENWPPALVKTIAKGKAQKMNPLATVAKAIAKDIVSKDAEKATNAQISFDALEQTRSDLLMRIKMEYRDCPHRAVYDLQQLLKYWPTEKKRLETVVAKLKTNPEAAKLAQMYCKLMAWAEPDFTCKNAGEVKKIIGELNKMKKDLEKLKESKVIVVQNGALLMDAQVDELISLIPTKVPEK